MNLTVAAWTAIDEALEAFFAGPAADLAHTPGVVAFSGGPDSTALLAALARRGADVVAAHLDHATDRESAERAAIAAQTARELGVRFVTGRLAAAPASEAAGREARYTFLERVARERGASWVATGHHLDDQAETVVLRMLQGTGVEGLAAMAPRGIVPRGELPLLRPLLGLRREELAAAVAGLRVTDDPGNRDPAILRSAVRQKLLPVLEAAARREGEEAVAPRLARLAMAARGAAAAIERRLGKWLAPVRTEGGASMDGAALAKLPAPLLPHALALLHRTARLPYPPAAAAATELARQLAAGGAVAVDCGDGWRWRTADGRLRLERRPRRSPGQAFSYILAIPGEVEIVELSTVVRLYRAPVARWMYRGAADRAALALPLEPGSRVTVRNRRPGDRLRPLGASGSRRLKEVLIDRRVPRSERDRLPLLCIGDGGDVAWVPGVTVDERFRLPEAPAAGATVWVAELERR